jgi:hypothetical protein
MLAFTDALGLKSSALYIFDYSAPTGFRLTMGRPERVTAIVSQNGKAYVGGRGDARATSRRCSMHPTSENREAIRKGLNAERGRGEYSVGIPNRSCEANLIDMFIRKIRQITETALRISGDQNLGMRVDVALGSGGRCGGPYIPITQAAGEMRLETVRIPSGVGSYDALLAQPVECPKQKNVEPPLGRATAPENRESAAIRRRCQTAREQLG